MIPTTVIGSYPVRLDGTKYSKAYFGNAKSDAPKEAVKQAVSSQVDAGIDIISDGQTTGDFINIFARNFRGVLIQSRPVVFKELDYVGYATVERQKTVRKLIPKNLKLKGIITGPYTMAKSSENRHYNGTKELAFAYARGLALEAKKLSEVVDYIQLDEPFFSVDYPEYGKELTEEVLKSVKVARMLHVCGDVSRIFHELVDYKLDYLEHEFAANPNLWEAVKCVDFKQTIGVGVVRSDINRAETVDEILARMRKAVTSRDSEKIMFNPDCGMRNLDPDVAYAKLKNMVTARNLLAEEI